MATITENIARIQQAKEDIKDAIIAKGVEVSDDVRIDGYADKIGEIQQGGGEVIYAFAEEMLDGGHGTSIIRKIRISEGTTAIIDSAYSGTGIEELYIPDSVITLGRSICANCSKLVKVRFPHNLNKIPPYFFRGCTALKSYTIAEQFNSIDSAAFYQCTNIAYIEAMGNLDYIGDYVFEACTSLKSIKLKAVQTMHHTAFFNLGTSVIIDSANPPSLTGAMKIGASMKFYVPDAAVEYYKAATNWSVVADKIYPLSEYTES